MTDHRFNVLVAAAAVSLAIAGDAAAGGCCPGPYATGIYASCGCALSDPAPGGYPYVGYIFSGYPYGLQDSGGYPRGAYSPYTGYPYVEPSPRGGLYTNYRQAPAYRRHIRPR